MRALLPTRGVRWATCYLLAASETGPFDLLTDGTAFPRLILLLPRFSDVTTLAPPPTLVSDSRP